MAVCFARAVIGLNVLFASGCLIGFDSSRLTGGGETGSGGNHGGASAPADMLPAPADMGGVPVASACDDLSPYMPGAQLTDWVQNKGSWIVTMMAQGKVLIQTTSSTSRHDRFVAWRGGKDVADVTVSSVALLDGNPTDVNCVLARVADAANYYALCVENVGGHMGPQMRQWTIDSVVGGTETSLASATIPIAPSHVLSLKVQGTTLTATVDGDTKPPVSDGALAHGFVGVSTDNGGGFFNLCTGTK